MQNIQLATISPSNRTEGKFTVCAHSDDGRQSADFDCDSERDAIALRNAIRTHAARLRHVTDFRDKPGRAAGGAEIARLQAQVAELQARCIDAESNAQRYRHLRNQEAGSFPPKHGTVWVVMYDCPEGGAFPSMVSAGHGERLDANVDAALAAAGR